MGLRIYLAPASVVAVPGARPSSGLLIRARASVRLALREEGAETLIEQMTRDQDPIIRYGGMFVVGLAYRGTANNGAIQKLLHFAVSDVSDDVRRAAVMCIGFVLMGVPEQCPRIVALLVRRGAGRPGCGGRQPG
jgi:HEAT repeat protein